MLALKGSEGGNIGGQCDHISLGKYVELWKISKYKAQEFFEIKKGFLIFYVSHVFIHNIIILYCL